MKRKLPEIIDLTRDDEADTVKVPRPGGSIPGPSQPPFPPTSPQNKYDYLYARITTIFPGICLEYVRQLHKHHTEATTDIDAEEALINHIIDSGPYPQGNEGTKLEKSRQETPQKPSQPGSFKRVGDRNDGIFQYGYFYRDARYLLQLDFPEVPPEYIHSVLQSQKSLFAAYSSLDQAENTYDMSNPALYKRRRGSKTDALGLSPNVPINSDLLRELQVAREERRKKEESRRQEQELAKLEAQNEATCIAQGNVMECQCCYADVPTSRMIPCTGQNIHFFCKECVRSAAKTQIGIMKYEVNCMDMSGCAAGFHKQTLAKVLGESLMRKVEQLQQRDEIAKAGLEGLHDCPFCDFRAICPPVEVDREFRCHNPSCRKVSCRLCGLESHIPNTCEQANDKKTPARQKIEEAMSEALIRTCPNPNCKLKIVKEDGCNKMICVKCRSAMCYVCKKDISSEGYKHFGKPPKRCPVHDPKSNARDFEEVSSAHKKAMEEVMTANPELKQGELAVEAPKREHHTRPTIIGRHRYNQHLPNQHQYYNALLRQDEIPGAAARPAQPGAGGPAAHAQFPVHAVMDQNPPQTVAYAQPFPIQNGANHFDPYGRVLEWVNVVEQPPPQPIAQHDFQQAGLWNQGVAFQIIPPTVMPPMPHYEQFRHDPNFHPQHHDHRHHHSHPPQVGYASQGHPALLPQHKPLEAQNSQNQNQNHTDKQYQYHPNLHQGAHQGQQHPQPQLQPEKPQLGREFQPGQHILHPQHAPLAPKHPATQIRPDLLFPNSATECIQPYPPRAEPAYMQAGPFVSNPHAISNNSNHNNNNHNNNNNNNTTYHNPGPTFRYPLDVPDIAPQQFSRN
ncbi:hypothetical protein ACJ72_05050 [Emergomyces africanus]|uniref:RING-type domain-containing protein n=1 Tax=Emergomyces africanus TaxID=1955775 RepID=A0A1B7NV24_9EURO|nr:hypothetical protein ACJ72_05050 [Emergomyces africanus]